MQNRNNSSLILSLQEYITELELENKQLKAHIFNLQEKQLKSIHVFHDEKEKLAIYVEQCEHQIIKRESREVILIESLERNDKEMTLLEQERDTYIEEIQFMRKELAQRNTQNSVLTKELYQQKQMALHSNTKSNIANLAGNLPPKSGKCKTCDHYSKAKDNYQIEIGLRDQKIIELQKDVQSLADFLQ